MKRTLMLTTCLALAACPSDPTASAGGLATAKKPKADFKGVDGLNAEFEVTATPSADFKGVDGLNAKPKPTQVTVVPSDIDGALDKWDGDGANPFALEKYRVRWTKTGVGNVDAFTKKAAQLQATIVAARFLADEIGTGNADAVAAAPKVLTLVHQAKEAGPKLAAEGTALQKELGTATGSAAVAAAIVALDNALEQAPVVEKQLSAASVEANATP